MRRNTVKVGIDLSQNAVKPLKKYNTHTKPKLASAGYLYSQFKVNLNMAYSETVAKTLVEDLL